MSQGKNKKLIVALVSLCSVMAVTILSMGIVWAATNQSVTSTLQVTFSASNVVADVSANKYYTSDTAIPFTGGTNGVVSFVARDASTTGALTTTATTLDLGTNQDFVIYEYIIVNNGANTITAALATAATPTNLTFYVSAPNTTRKTNVVTTFDASNYTAGSSIAATDIAGHTTAYAYLVMQLTDDTTDATFNGAYLWTLENKAS